MPLKHPVYKALHKPLTICGIEQRAFFWCAIVGVVMWQQFYSFFGGLLMSLGLYSFARWMTKHDPQMLHIIFASQKFSARRYDGAKHEPWEIEIQ